MLRFTLVLTILWLPSLLVIDWDNPTNFFFWRHQLTMYTGLLGLGYMGFAVLLAARFRWIENKINGLDKSYRLHKHLGIGALVALCLHWLIIQSAKWLVMSGMLTRPNRGPRPEIVGINWRALAEQVGDVSFKLFLIFCLISLIQAISYTRFRFTHKVGGLLMIAGVFHAVFLLDWNTAAMPMNLTVFAISIVGVVCAGISLTGQIGKQNKVQGTVGNVERFTDNHGNNLVIRFPVRLQSELHYREGQFAYLDFHDGESPHPFSILDFNSETNTIVFGVKNLGDYTSKMVNSLSQGQTVTVEGGYGSFHIPKAQQQVWVGAGIGIVPFLSHLYWLKRTRQSSAPEKVWLFYCVNSSKEAFFHKEILTLLSYLSFVELHIIDADKGQLLSSKQIIETCNDLDVEVCFCGPASFSHKLSSGLISMGVPENRFHTELFNLR